jgi:hypothetical protein
VTPLPVVLLPLLRTIQDPILPGMVTRPISEAATRLHPLILSAPLSKWARLPPTDLLVGELRRPLSARWTDPLLPSRGTLPLTQSSSLSSEFAQYAVMQGAMGASAGATDVPTTAS